MTKNYKLYKGDYYQVYNINNYSSYYKSPNDYLCFKVHSLITNYYTDLIHYETPVITVDNQEKFDQFAKQHMLYSKMYLYSRDCSINGETFVQLWIDEDENVYPIVHDQGTVKIIGNEINEQLPPEAYQLTHVLDEKKQIKLLETHYSGSIEYKIVDKKDNLVSFTQYPDLLEQLQYDTYLSTDTLLIAPTGYEFNLITHFKNEPNNELYGESDYSIALEAKSKQLNQLLNTTFGVILKHSDPRAIIEKNTYKAIKQQIADRLSKNNAQEDGIISLDQAAIRQIADMNSVSHAEVEMVMRQTMVMQANPMSNQKAFEYVTWDGKLDEAFRMFDLLQELIYSEMGLSKVAVSPDPESAQLSGVAYKRHVGPALRRAKNKREAFEASMTLLVMKAMQIITGKENAVSIKFGDGLDNDIHAVIDKYTKLIDYNLTTLSAAIQEIHNLDEEAANDYLSSISEERNLIGAVV